MISANTLLKRILNVKDTVVKSADFFIGANGVANLKILAAPEYMRTTDVRSAGSTAPFMTGQHIKDTGELWISEE